MKTIKSELTYGGYRTNSFGQLVQENPETYTATEIVGTLDEIIAYSMDREIYVRRSPVTEHLFPAWFSSAKFVVLYRGEASQFADDLKELGPAFRMRIDKGTVEGGEQA